MPRKKLLVIGPISPQPSDLSSLSRTLHFLEPYYSIDCLDSLAYMQECTTEEYYEIWKDQLKQIIDNYKAFIGFSFGGMILQQCFSLFSNLDKTIILFSTPTFADDSLKEKLETVITLCSENKLEEALFFLYRSVYSPDAIFHYPQEHLNRERAIDRLVFGLSKVLETNATSILRNCCINHLHLIGEKSNLVNINNVIKPSCGEVIIVPNASMRVLESNPSYCKKIILEALKYATC
ncbi:hypothetical protein EP47_13055 [Legionella norrlandica]|uniref:Alpha/beta hydrolase n=1 Tax=Legionella norrlandica TaxID=1498499 RepID=A0A0A2STP0_9GAMM|nr:hypothetical protein [Legionella norrlandica]KGP62794.1 hypothetical protein EP47_13055 [Legionella norrlandica]